MTDLDRLYEERATEDAARETLEATLATSHAYQGTAPWEND